MFICYYLIALPLALALCFTYGPGLKGIWMGFALATIILVGGMLFIIYRNDWSQIADQMKSTLNDSFAYKVE